MKKLIYFTLVISMLLVLVGCSEDGAISSPEEIQGMTIGALAGTPSLRLARENGTARAFYSESEMMRALRAEVIDAVIMEQATAMELVENTSGVRILNEPLVEYDLRIAIAMENVGLLNAVNNALAELEENGTLEGLAYQYFARGDFAYEPPENIEMRPGYLTVAFPPDSPPFSFRNADDMFVGMDVEVAVAIGHVLGIELTVLEQDPRELVTAVWHGRADLALGWHPYEGEGFVNMSNPYASAVHVVIVRR
ncbi:MAG: transporter substrate-binding domain-containing protein [Oscillospiraceae bacterium]|nr:transporter substrate-binding domain-containing protein [Oscillospiraceae bacterium]